SCCVSTAVGDAAGAVAAARSRGRGTASVGTASAPDVTTLAELSVGVGTGGGGLVTGSTGGEGTFPLCSSYTGAEATATLAAAPRDRVGRSHRPRAQASSRRPPTNTASPSAARLANTRNHAAAPDLL